jgi:acyl carrier protein
MEFEKEFNISIPDEQAEKNNYSRRSSSLLRKRGWKIKK